jgi:hypothetical protein
MIRAAMVKAAKIIQIRTKLTRTGHLSKRQKITPAIVTIKKFAKTATLNFRTL